MGTGTGTRKNCHPAVHEPDDGTEPPVHGDASQRLQRLEKMGTGAGRTSEEMRVGQLRVYDRRTRRAPIPVPGQDLETEDYIREIRLPGSHRMGHEKCIREGASRKT